MQTQDIKYVTTKRTIEAKKIQRMQSELHMLDAANDVKNTHIFFTDDEPTEEFDLAKRLDTHPALLNRRTNRTRLKDLEKLAISDADVDVIFFFICPSTFPNRMFPDKSYKALIKKTVCSRFSCMSVSLVQGYVTTIGVP